MSPEKSRIITELKTREFDWSKIAEQTSQIILFGSWAISAQCEFSDIDLLCVGEGSRFKSSLLDIVWRSPQQLLADKWLGSELANHIAHYGLWLHGRDDWGSKVYYSEQALLFKRRLIRSRFSALFRLWPTLSPAYRQKHVVKLRRDIQRLALIKSRSPMKPSPLLDREWIDSSPSVAHLIDILKRSNESSLLKASDLEVTSQFILAPDFR